MVRFTSFCVLFLLLLSCATKEEPTTDVYEIKSIGILATTEFTIGKVVKLNDNKEWYKFGDRKILISTHAKVKAGVNLLSLQEGDITVVGKKLTIHLPPAEITSFEMDPSQIKTEMEDVNGLRMGFTQEEKNKILRLGEKSIQEEIEKTNILKEAKKNAVAFTKEFYKELGYEEVNVEFKELKK